MLAMVARLRRLLADCRGSFFIEYSSLVLLLAMAAIALVAQVHGPTPN
jgi:Flp pilus assembly pilin Flp